MVEKETQLGRLTIGCLFTIFVGLLIIIVIVSFITILNY